MIRQQELDADDLPPLAPPEASDDERGRAIDARMAARYGAPSIEDYRTWIMSVSSRTPVVPELFHPARGDQP